MLKRPWSRRELQSVLAPAVQSLLGRMELPADVAHQRRVVRSLLRIACRYALDNGYSPQAIITACNHCMESEATDWLAARFSIDAADINAPKAKA